MNRGTALKWIELLESGNYKVCYTQTVLRMYNEYDPVGVLCDLLYPSGWKLSAMGWDMWHGESHYIPDSMLKRVKINTNICWQMLVTPIFSLISLSY